MGLLRWSGPALFVAGGAALALAAVRGEASLSLVVIVPVVTATGGLGALAILLLVAGFLVTFVAWPLHAAREVAAAPIDEPIGVQPPPPGPAARRWGGVLFLGPVPIVFGSDARVTRGMLLLGLILFLALLGLTVAFLVSGA